SVNYGGVLRASTRAVTQPSAVRGHFFFNISSIVTCTRILHLNSWRHANAIPPPTPARDANRASTPTTLTAPHRTRDAHRATSHMAQADHAKLKRVVGP